MVILFRTLQGSPKWISSEILLEISLPILPAFFQSILRRFFQNVLQKINDNSKTTASSNFLRYYFGLSKTILGFSPDMFSLILQKNSPVVTVGYPEFPPRKSTNSRVFEKKKLKGFFKNATRTPPPVQLFFHVSSQEPKNSLRGSSNKSIFFYKFFQYFIQIYSSIQSKYHPCSFSEYFSKCLSKHFHLIFKGLFKFLQQLILQQFFQ